MPPAYPKGPRNPEIAPCIYRILMIRLEKLRPSDYREMLSVWERAGLPFKPTGRDSRKHILRQLGLPTALYLKAVEYGPGGRTRGTPAGKAWGRKGRGRMVAVVLGTHDGRKGYVNRLAVLPGYRRKGLGKRLVRELERRFSKIGIGIITCQIEDWNTVSLKVFKQLGYVLHHDIHYLSKRKVDGI